MSVPELKPAYLKMVPEFSGEIELLPRFITICEKLILKFYNQTNPADFQNDYLLDSILAKIQGDAQRNISSCVINSWDDLKKALVTTYSDKRDIHTLVIEMCSLKQTNEQTFEYYNKILKMVNLQTSYITTHQVEGGEQLKKFVSDLGLRTLLRGLKEPLGSLMRTKNPNDINDALNILINDFQIETSETKSPYTNKNNNNNKSNYKQNDSKYKNTNNRYIPPHERNNNTTNQVGNSGYQPLPLFNPMKNNLNNQYHDKNRGTGQPSTSFNKSNFNNYNNKNQSFGGQNQVRSLPKPTPMSGVSHIHNMDGQNTILEESTYNPEIDFGYVNEDPPSDVNFPEEASENQSN